MRFIADINITQTVIRNLRSDSHDVLDIKKENPTISDINLLKIAQKENSIIITHDKDFEELTERGYQIGIIVIRLKIQNAQHHWVKLKELLLNSTEEVLNKSITILKEESANPIPYN